MSCKRNAAITQYQAMRQEGNEVYPPELTKPMAQELIDAGIAELKTPNAVDETLKQDGSTLVVINSVCGCAAGNARPGIKLALQNDVTPDRTVTVFAGVDVDAVNKVRSSAPSFPASSPSFILFKNGDPAFILHRSEIEGFSPQEVAFKLTRAFEQHCG